jgi:hypothetical protein
LRLKAIDTDASPRLTAVLLFPVPGPFFPVPRAFTGKKLGFGLSPHKNIVFDQSLAKPITWAENREIIRLNRGLK